ncbi:MAG: DNA primase [Acidobacteriota bacterium]
MDFAQDLKAQIDIVRVISDYVPRLRRFGNRYSGLCPFHNEKTPSFSIYAEHQFYKCYGCDAKGDVFNFVMTIEGLTFWEALKKLADQHGIPLPKQSQAGDDKTRLRAALYEMHEIAAEQFRANLAGNSGAPVRAYLNERGVTQAAAQQFQLGLSDRSGRALLRLLEQRGFKPEQMTASGLIGRGEDGSLYDRFRNRLMFPIHSESGKIIAFGGRALDAGEKAKYINSIETEIYKKGSVLYNLNRAKQTASQQDRIVLVEGYMDVIGASQAGVVEVVASCGTALTVEQIRAMKRHSQNLHLNFDPDAAGAKASERSISLLLDENMHVRMVELEGGLDPDEFCKEHGAELYRTRVAGAKDYFYWLADRARARYNMREPQGRIEVFQFLLPAIQGLNDKLKRAAVASDLASYLGVDSGSVLEQFRRMAADRVERTIAPAADPARTTDRILLPLLVGDAEARQELMEGLRGIAALLEGSTAPIYDVLMTMHQAGEAISFNSVHERLAPPDQERLAAIVLDPGAAATGLENGLACLNTLRREQRDSRLRELKARIRQAEREGRMQDALRLMSELNEYSGLPQN